MSDDYTPTTMDVLRYFCPPRYKTDPQRPGETLGEFVGRMSPNTLHEGFESEAAARRWLAEHDRQVAEKAWDEGQGEGVVAAINHTPLLPNPYRTAEDAPHE